MNQRRSGPLDVSGIQLNAAELQYQVQPMEKGGAVSGRKPQCSSNLMQPLLLCNVTITLEAKHM